MTPRSCSSIGSTDAAGEIREARCTKEPQRKNQNPKNLNMTRSLTVGKCFMQNFYWDACSWHIFYGGNSLNLNRFCKGEQFDDLASHMQSAQHQASMKKFKIRYNQFIKMSRILILKARLPRAAGLKKLRYFKALINYE
jgi:hypothetical protein